MSVTTPDTFAEHSNQDPTLRVMELIHGVDIERNLLDLAQIGGTPIEGTPEQPERYSVNRLALGEADKMARDTFIRPLMETAGMEVQEHPLGIIGTRYGKNRDLAPLIIFSHTDSVPDGDMYDGDLGVIGGIKVVQAMGEAGIENERDIHVISLTGEESAGFGMALFGSRGMFHGLTDKELDSRIDGGKSIREVLGETDTEIVKVPIVGEGKLIKAPYGVVELHVEQNDTLDKAGIDLGVVERIAAPMRYKVQVGEKALEQDETEPAHAMYLKLNVHGESNHSGATPMGLADRADGLVETANFLLPLLRNESIANGLDIGTVTVDGGALNKVPGLTTTYLRVSGDSELDVVDKLEALQQLERARNTELDQPGLHFGDTPITIELAAKAEAGGFFKRAEVAPRQIAALSLIAAVNTIATHYGGEKVVGTVGTYKVSADGKISLGLDVRGMEKGSRDSAINHMIASALSSDVADEDMPRFGHSLEGSGDPVTLDAELVQTAYDLIGKYNIGSHQVMDSAAGHDAQNAAKAGYPTVMIFAQSNANGAAHNPEAYTNTENLEKAVRAFAALIVDLAA